MRCEVRGQEGAAATTAAATAASTTTAVQVEVRVELAEVAKPETGSLAIVEATRRHDRNWGGPPEMTALRRSFAAPAYKSSFVLLSLLGLLLRINPTTVASGLRLGSDRVAFIVHSKANNVTNDDNNNDDNNNDDEDNDDDDDDEEGKKDDENNYDEDDRFMHHSARANLDVDATNLIDTPGIIEDTRPTRYFPFISERSRLNIVRYQRSKAKIYSSTRGGSLDRRPVDRSSFSSYYYFLPLNTGVVIRTMLTRTQKNRTKERRKDAASEVEDAKDDRRGKGKG
ncbi:LOW QUALITY PROTEIN: follistatin-A isoform X1 [Vespula maculifrons]|uniref:Follistatin-A isoform X1 n=1 Tax=Vespula maculifrons TaxID=7453 RepID=A0ABD2AWP8_VESMC